MTIEWDQVSLVKQGVTILERASLQVAPGELVGIIGRNGAGKSALLRLAVGLERPSAGVLRLGGRCLDQVGAAERARLLAFLPQQAEAAWPISVQDAVALGRLPHGGGGAAVDRDAVRRALAAVGMAALASRRLTQLSGGERALALLARALAVEAGTLLLDEPTASLDTAHQLQVMELLRDRATAGDAVVVVLHDLALAARCCDRLVVLHQGRIEASGSGDAILDDPLLRQVFGITVRRGEVDGQPVFLPSRWVA